VTDPRSASPLASPVADWTGADIRGLDDLAGTLYGYLAEITGVITELHQEVARLTGGGQGWRGPVASSFTAAWQRDVAAVEALAQVVAWTGDAVADLAVELAAIEASLEEAAHATAGYSQAYDRGMAAARRASEQAALRLTDLLAVFTAGPEPVLRQAVDAERLTASWAQAARARPCPGTG
jgi:uncharacterized protein YukE